MDQLFMILVLALLACAIVWGCVYACRALSVPLVGQWAVAAVIVIVLLYALVRVVNGGGVHMPALR